MNSAMQVLVNLPPFYNFLAWLPDRSSKDAQGASTTPILDALKAFSRQFPVQKEFGKGYRKHSNFIIGQPFTVHNFVDNITKHRRFDQGQQDVEEYLSFILGKLKK
ncbi:MAG: hypothetical protein AAF826_10580 [Pseudomonadota bacterium]